MTGLKTDPKALAEMIASALHWESLMKDPVYAAMADRAEAGDEAARAELSRICHEAGHWS